MSKEIRTEFIEANGQTFEVDICGDGDKFAICLHGFPELAYSWRYQLPLLAELGYTVWAPNLRGYGNSSRPKKVMDYSIDILVEDVAALIDAAGAKSTLLIGHDWGGGIAWNFALQYKRPLDGLIAMNIPHPLIFSQHITKWAQLKKSWYIIAFQIPKLPEYILGRSGAKMIGDLFYNMALDKSRFPPEVLDKFRKNALQPGALTAMINYYRAVARIANNDEQQKIMETHLDTPTLMIWGEQDSALGKELTYGTEELVSNFTIRYLPNVSHWVQQEAPETVNKMIKAWLEKTDVPQA